MTRREEVKIRIGIMNEIHEIDLPLFLHEYITMEISETTYFRAKNFLNSIANAVRTFHHLSAEYYQYIKKVNGIGKCDMQPHTLSVYMTEQLYREKVKLSIPKETISKIDSIRKAKAYFIMKQYCNFISSTE